MNERMTHRDSRRRGARAFRRGLFVCVFGLLVSDPSFADGLRESPETNRIGQWIDDLANDSERNNAKRALAQLRAVGAKADAALHDALDSKDPQQRHFAAHLLRARNSSAPSQKLLAVTVEGLRDDNLPEYPRKAPYIWNAVEGVEFLLGNVEVAKSHLLVALDATDGQQRFLAAYIVAMSRREWRVERVCSILIEHLEDNEVRNDASLSSTALARLGRPALPSLFENRGSLDVQQRDLIELVIRKIEGKPTAAHELNVLFTPDRETPSVNIPTIPKRVRWLALQGLLTGSTRTPSLSRLRKIHGKKLIIREIAHSDEYSTVQLGLGPFAGNVLAKELDEQNIWKVLLTIRVHYSGEIYRKIPNETAGGSPTWVLEPRT